MVTMSEPLPDGHPDRWLPDGFKDPGPVTIELTPELRQAVIDGLELGGAAEISKEFDVPRSTASMWWLRRDRTGFPAPVGTLSQGAVFDMSAVRSWYEARYGKVEA